MKVFLALLLFFSIQKISAEEFSLRDCTLLPIVTSKAGDSIGYKIFEGIEGYLKEVNWCRYKSPANILGVFSRYRDKLDSYLEDEDVLRTVAKRLEVGTMIKASVQNTAKTVEVELKVFGENGKDLLFEEKTTVQKYDIPVIVETFVGWLKLYETSIPYDGRVLGVLGDQVTIDFGKTYSVVIGQEFKVSRMRKSVKHPLLKKVVSWETISLGEGRIFNISKNQALGVIKVRTNKSGIVKGDWVQLEKAPIKKPFDPDVFNDNSQHKFGRLGELELYGLIGNTAVSTLGSNGRTNQDGLTYGLQVRAEAWITREYFVLGEYMAKFGTLKKASGNPDSDTLNISTSTIKIAGGYKYLPLGFFYGPQVNVYAGFALHNYELSTSSADGYGANSINGLMFGVYGAIPLKKGIRMSLRAELLPFARFEDDSGIYGANENANSMKLEAQLSYRFSRQMTLLGGFETLNNGAKFGSLPSDLSYNENIVKVGAGFRF